MFRYDAKENPKREGISPNERIDFYPNLRALTSTSPVAPSACGRKSPRVSRPSLLNWIPGSVNQAEERQQMGAFMQMLPHCRSGGGGGGGAGKGALACLGCHVYSLFFTCYTRYLQSRVGAFMYIFQWRFLQP